MPIGILRVELWPKIRKKHPQLKKTTGGELRVYRASVRLGI